MATAEATTPPRAIESIGRLAMFLQTSPTQILAAAKSAGIEPEITISGVAHFRDTDIASIRQALAADQKGKANV